MRSNLENVDRGSAAKCKHCYHFEFLGNYEILYTLLRKQLVSNFEPENLKNLATFWAEANLQLIV